MIWGIILAASITAALSPEKTRITNLLLWLIILLLAYK